MQREMDGDSAEPGLYNNTQLGRVKYSEHIHLSRLPFFSNSLFLFSLLIVLLLLYVVYV